MGLKEKLEEWKKKQDLLRQQRMTEKVEEQKIYQEEYRKARLGALKERARQRAREKALRPTFAERFAGMVQPKKQKIVIIKGKGKGRRKIIKYVERKRKSLDIGDVLLGTPRKAEKSKKKSLFDEEFLFGR